MASRKERYYRSNTLDAQWEDLSQSVSHLLQEHEGGGKEGVHDERRVSRKHWVNALERKDCVAPECRRRFTVTERKHHCRRCGDVFCGKCSQYRRRLSVFATPDPDGINCRVCRSCFEVGPQTIGSSRSYLDNFISYRQRRKLKHQGENNNQDSPSTQIDIEAECSRLVNGFKSKVGSSRIKSFFTEALSPVKVPEWQKSEHWVKKATVDNCSLCESKFTVMEMKSHCRVCGSVICSSCSSDTMILFVQEDKSVHWTLINVIGSPDQEPAVCVYLKICNSCHSKAALIQAQDTIDGGNPGWDLDTVASINKKLSTLQGKVDTLLPTYESLADAVEAKTNLQGLVPVGSSATQALAKYHLDLSDMFTQFAVDMQGLKRLKPKTNAQIKLTKNLTRSKFNYYNDNISVFRECKKRLSEMLPCEVMEKIQAIVNENAINSAYIVVKQLGFEALLLSDKYNFNSEVARLLAQCEEVCLEYLRKQIEESKGCWETHEQTLKALIQEQLKEHRMVVPSKTLTKSRGASYVHTFLVERSDLLICQTIHQLCAKTTEKKFSGCKDVLKDASKQISQIEMISIVPT